MKLDWTIAKATVVFSEGRAYIFRPETHIVAATVYTPSVILPIVIDQGSVPVTGFQPTLSLSALDFQLPLESIPVLVYSPELVLAAQQFSPDLFTVPVTSFAPTLDLVPLDFTPELLAVPVSAFTPSLTITPQDFTPALHTVPVTLYGPSLVLTALDFTPGLLSVPITVYDPTLELSPLLSDTYTTNLTAGNVDGSASEPGPGTRYATSTVSISGGRLQLPNDAQGGLDDAIARITGYALRARYGGSGSFMTGFASGKSWNSQNGLIYRYNGGELRQNSSGGLILANAYYDDTCIVVRSDGKHYLYNDGSDWILAYTSRAHSYDPMFSGGRPYSGGDNYIEFMRLYSLGAPFNSLTGLTDHFQSSPSNGHTHTHSADGQLELYNITLPSSGEIEYRFRQQDASNYWRVTINSSGDLDLDEVVAGTPTQRASSSGAVGGGQRLVLRLNDTTIEAVVNDLQKWSYGSATNFKTETDAEVENLGTGGAIGELSSRPRVMTGSAKSILDSL